MFRMGKLTDYGTVLLGILASDPGSLQTAAQLAAGSGIAAPTVS